MKTPLISLIIPMYNAENYIKECLDSVVGQTYENIEVIIVDDASMDKSAEIAVTYAGKRKNFTYIKTKNGNATKTRRDGLKKATAELVCFVDADDVLDENYVKKLYQAMCETQSEISACSIQTFVGDFEPRQHQASSKIHVLKSDANTFADHYHITDENKLTLQTLPCKLFKKQLFDNIDYDVLTTNIFEDNFIMVQVLRKVENIGVIDDTLYWYRQTSGSTSGGTVATTVEHQGEKLNSVEFFRDVVMEYCRKMLHGPDVNAAIDRLSAAEFFNYARMVPDLIVHKEYLEQKIALEEARLEDRELQIKVKDEQIANRDKQISDILNSKSYKIGHKVMKPTSKAVEILRRSRK